MKCGRKHSLSLSEVMKVSLPNNELFPPTSRGRQGGAWKWTSGGVNTVLIMSKFQGFSQQQTESRMSSPGQASLAVSDQTALIIKCRILLLYWRTKLRKTVKSKFATGLIDNEWKYVRCIPQSNGWDHHGSHLCLGITLYIGYEYD